MATRAVLYARVSGDDRIKEGRNLASQLRMAREYAIEHNYTIIAELAEDDRGASGIDLDLEQLNRALDMARNGEFDVLIVRELDRFARSLAKQLIIETEFKKADIRIEYVIEEYDDTPEGILRKNLRATIAEYERLKIAERTKRAKRDKARAGHVVACARVPYGYQVVNENGHRTLEPHEPEASVIRMIYDWYTGNGVERKAGRAIARSLDELGAPSWSDLHPGQSSRQRTSSAWSPSSVNLILKNPLYKGDWHFADVDMGVPPIVSEEIWQKAQHYRKQNQRSSWRGGKYKYLLTGRIRCGTCGAAMRGVTSTTSKKRKKRSQHKYYRCQAKNEPSYARECDGPNFRLNDVDAAVWAKVKEWLSEPAKLETGYAQYLANRERELAPIRERIATIDQLLAENRDQLERLVDLYLSQEIDKGLLLGRKRRLEKTIGSLESERARQTAVLEKQVVTEMEVRDISEFAAKVRAGLANANGSFEAKREVLELLNVEAVCLAEDDVKKVRVTAVIGLDDVLSLANTSP
jgi:site-specific DNA recombinase